MGRADRRAKRQGARALRSERQGARALRSDMGLAIKQMTIRRRSKLVTLLAVPLILIVTACGGSDPNDGSGNFLTGGSSGGDPVRGGTLTFDRALEPESLNPIGPSDNGSIWVQTNIYDQLVEQLPGESEPQPGLATSWTISPDGLTYDFTLRQGVKFSDGSPVTPEDVKFSLERWADPKQNLSFAPLSANVKRVSLPDSRTLRLELSQPTPALLYYLSMFVASVVPSKVVERVGDKRFGRAPIGSGAFMVKDFIRGQRLELVRNPHYWRKGKPYLAGVTFNLVPDDNARILAIRSGEADVAERIPFRQVDELTRASGVSVLVEPLAAMSNIWLNHTVAPLNKLNVRRALSYATPREAIRRTAFGGKAEISTGLLPKLKYWDDKAPVPPEDPEKAKQLLARAGEPGGFSIRLLMPRDDEAIKQVAAILQQAWAKIGVKVKLDPVDSTTLFDRYIAGDFDANVFGTDQITSDVPVDDEFAFQVYDINGGFKAFFTYYKSQQATMLVDEVTTELDENRRHELFAQLQRLTTVDDVQSVPMVYIPARTAVRDDVRNFNTLPTGGWRLDEVYLGQSD